MMMGKINTIVDQKVMIVKREGKVYTDNFASAILCEELEGPQAKKYQETGKHGLMRGVMSGWWRWRK
jgi:hypothetical protein